MNEGGKQVIEKEGERRRRIRRNKGTGRKMVDQIDRQAGRQAGRQVDG